MHYYDKKKVVEIEVQRTRAVVVDEAHREHARKLLQLEHREHLRVLSTELLEHRKVLRLGAAHFGARESSGARRPAEDTHAVTRCG